MFTAEYEDWGPRANFRGRKPQGYPYPIFFSTRQTRAANRRIRQLRNNWPKTRRLHYDVLIVDDSFSMCSGRHTTKAEAERCGKERLRMLQLRSNHTEPFLRLFNRPFADPPDLDQADAHLPRGKPPLSSTRWHALQEIYGHRCYYCRKRSDALELEHRIPVSRGGTDDFDNLVPGCHSCNRRKYTKTDREFLEAISAPHVREDKRRQLPAGFKLCASCGELLSLDDFVRSRNKADGRASYCRPCHREREVERRRKLEREADQRTTDRLSQEPDAQV